MPQSHFRMPLLWFIICTIVITSATPGRMQGHCYTHTMITKPTETENSSCSCQPPIMVYKVQVRTLEEMMVFLCAFIFFLFMWQIKANWEKKTKNKTPNHQQQRKFKQMQSVYIDWSCSYYIWKTFLPSPLQDAIFRFRMEAYLDGRENKHKETASAITFPD